MKSDTIREGKFDNEFLSCFIVKIVAVHQKVKNARNPYFQNLPLSSPLLNILVVLRIQKLEKQLHFHEAGALVVINYES